MRHFLGLFLLVSCLGGCLGSGQDEIVPFDLYCEYSPSQLVFHSEGGTGWKHMTWEMDPGPEGLPYTRQLDAHLPSAEGGEAAGLLADVEIGRGRISFQAVRGVHWARLDVGLRQQYPFCFHLDENGVTLLNEPLGDPPGGDSPLVVLLRVIHAMLTEDQQGFEACFLAPGPYAEAIAAQGRYYLAANRFKNAFTAAYGYDAWLATLKTREGRVETISPGYYNLIKLMKLPAARGDTVEVSLLGGDWPATVVRHQGQWLVSAPHFIGVELDPEANTRVLNGVVAALERFQPAIGHPGLKPEDIDHELDRALMAALLGGPLPEPERFDPEDLR
jgi:hypothetical protein